MKEAVLHVGMHKSGSTSIQACLDGHDDGKVRYARLGDVNHSVPLYTLFSSRYRDYHVHTGVGSSPERIDALRERARAALERELSLERDTLVLSGEDMSLIEREGVRAMRDFLQARVERVRVVAYVREPVGFASSAIAQYVYGGMRTVRIPRPEYRERFEKYVDLFGADRVEFVKFDRAELFGRSVVPDFCRRVGIDPLAVGDTSTNESLSREVVQLLLRFNRDGVPSAGNPHLVRARGQFIEQLKGAFDGPTLKLPPALVWRHVDRDDVDWMERTSGLALGSAVEPAAADDREEALPEDIGGATLRKLQALVAAQDAAIARSARVVTLLDYLFLSRYFKVRRENVPTAVLIRGARRMRKRLLRAAASRRGVIGHRS